jgi:hypothetical protein
MSAVTRPGIPALAGAERWGTISRYKIALLVEFVSSSGSRWVQLLDEQNSAADTLTDSDLIVYMVHHRY